MFEEFILELKAHRPLQVWLLRPRIKQGAERRQKKQEETLSR
jgi:hypothetical protein